MVDIVTVVGCFMWHEGKFLILHRTPEAKPASCWGLPAGKVGAGENLITAIQRESFEETGYKVPKENFKQIDDRLFSPSSAEVYRFVTFTTNLPSPIPVYLNLREHDTYAWVTAEECYAKEDLIFGFHDLLRYVGYIASEQQ